MNFLRRCVRFPSCLLNNVKYMGTKLYEPEYLESMKSKVPLYDALNIQMRGYDYVVLENYQRLLHSLIKNMDIDVEDSWAVPAQELQIITYKPNSEILDSKYFLKNYERTIQVTDLSALQLQILLRAIDASAPEGVTVQVVPHEEYHEQVRYVPDQELKALKEQLETMSTKKK